MDKRTISWILLTFTMMFWGMSFVWTKQLLEYVSPITIISLRLIISTFILIIFAKLIGKWQLIAKRDVKWYFLLALFQPFLYFLFEGYGIQYSTASFAAIMIATIPLVTPIGERIFFKTRLSVMNYLGLFISFGGVALIVYNNSDSTVSLIGVLCLLGAVLSAAGYLMVLGKLAGKYNAFVLTAHQNLFGLILFLPLFLYKAPTDWPNLSWSVEIIWPLLALAVLASAIAFIFNTIGVRNLGPSKASAFTNSIPVFTTIFAFLLLGESIETVKIVGMGIVIGGLLLAQRASK